MLGIGAYGEAADESRGEASTTLALRLKYEGQGADLTQCFSGTYVSAISEPRSISITGPIDVLRELSTFAQEQEELQVVNMDIEGSFHTPRNKDLAETLSRICDQTAALQLPNASKLQVPVRSNITGEILTEGSLTRELITTVLEFKCDWYTVVVETAKDLKAARVTAPTLVCFGVTDSISLNPFHQQGLRPVREYVRSLILRVRESTPPTRSLSLYPENAIAIIGASTRLPGARNLDELWELLSKGEDRHEELKSDRFDLYHGFRFSQSDSLTKDRKFYGNFVDGVGNFDNAFFGIGAREMSNMDPQQRMLLELSYEALECSGYMCSHVRSRGDRVGCFIGASYTEYLENTTAHPPTAYTAPGTIRAFLCGRLSYYFGWTGPSEVIDTACSASLVAINRAIKAIQSGECPMAIAGGVNLITGANNYLDLAKAGFLSPTGQCKPFDKNADGYCRADGAGLVVLKSLKQAEADNDPIMGVILGASTSQGGLSDSLTVPSSDALVELYQSVLNQANISPEQVTYVEAHGTGTQAGDPKEIASLRSIFGSTSRTTELHIGSIKGNIGHCETAAGIAGVMKIICMLKHKAIPPQASHNIWNPKIPELSKARMRLAMSLKDWDVPFRAALINSYGAAGSNASIVCCEPPKSQLETPPLRPVDSQIPERGASIQPRPKLPFILSAKSPTSLKRYEESLVRYLTKTKPELPISGIASTLSKRRQQDGYYAVFEASDTSELIKNLTLDEAQKPTLKRGAPKSVVLTFSGQSKKTICLDRRFYETYSTFRSSLNTCDEILRELGYRPILPAIFDNTDISDVVILQTGFVAVQYACATTWMNAGLKVSAVIGHSLGELTALAVSGKLSIRDCLKLVAARADLIKTEWGPEKGSMLAIFSSRDDVARIIAGSKIEIACYNSDTSQVVTGESKAIADLERRLSLESQPIKCLKVDTSHGFHSRLVSPILERFNQVVASIEWKTPIIQIEFCTERHMDPDSLYSPSAHLRNPVFWLDAVRRLERSLGSCIFLESGINTPVIAMSRRAVIQPQDHEFVSLTTKDLEYPTDVVSHATCALWSSSIDVTHWGLAEPNCDINHTWLPPYQFDPTSAWLEHVDRAAVLQSQSKSAVPLQGSEAKISAEQVKLIKPIANFEDPAKRIRRFRIYVQGERFRGIVAGHAVRNRPLCPASVYLECVTMALGFVAGDLASSSLEFQGLDIQTALNLGSENVEIVLEEVIMQSFWSFKCVSRGHQEILHAKGWVKNSPQSRLETFRRLISNADNASKGNVDAERLLSRRAYSLFSRVVTYAPFLKGITSIMMSGTTAVGNIATAPDQPGTAESTVVETCDAVTLDTFIQVLGLLINTSDMPSDNTVMICTGIESSLISKSINMVSCRSWKVYASYTVSSPSQAIGDVFALDENGSLAAAFTGCRFIRLEIMRLERLLDSLDPQNRDTDDKQAPGGIHHRSVPIPPVIKSKKKIGTKLSHNNGSVSDESLSTPETLMPEKTVLELIEAYTGLATTNISDDAILGDLGLDSLAAIEMSEELHNSRRVLVAGPDLLNLSVRQLEQRISPLGSIA